MKLYCCTKCNLWNFCVTKWLRTEKGEENLCCESCQSYQECLSKSLEETLQERVSRIELLRRQLNGIFSSQKLKKANYGLEDKEWKIFVANYALTGFWILFGITSKALENNFFYTISIIPSIVVFWIILKKVQTSPQQI